MVMPMGPDFAKYLGFSEAHTGYVAGAYTAAASLAGLIGSTFLDRFDRRKALAFAIFGLVIGTALGGFATGFVSLVGSRLVAGAFGGPATALAFAIISDVIPAPLRGRAMGFTMAAFSAATVLGVPSGLWMSEHYGWRAPFFTVAAIGSIVSVVAIALLPPLTEHLAARARHHSSTRELLQRPTVVVSFVMGVTVMMAGFVVIPNISGYAQLNLHYPRTDIKLFYLFGGIASFAATQTSGWLIDRFGSFRVGTAGSVLLIGCLFAAFFREPSANFALFMVWFMTAMGVRNVSYNTLVSKVPKPEERARFQSLQSAVQHGASAAAGMVSAALLTRVPGEGFPARLEGMPKVATLSLALTVALPALLWFVERNVVAHARLSAAPQPAVGQSTEP